jgi:peptidoglycan/LPS O-acetylase OafA/YrhL
MELAQPSPRRLGHRPTLDGMRAIAVMLVIAIHVGLLVSGYIGVDVFLPLSGFLITALLYEESERTGTISLRRFYERRVRRLLPALLLLVAGFALVIVLLHPFSLDWSLSRLTTTTLLFVNNWVATLSPGHGSVLGALSPTWTLAQEGQFYLLWPPVLWMLVRRQTRPRTVLVLLGGAILVLLAAGILAPHVYPEYNEYTSPFDRGAELLLGAAVAILWRERMVPESLGRPLAGWIPVGGLTYLVIAGKPSVPVWYLMAAALSALLIVNLLTARPVPARRSGRRRSLPEPGLSLERILCWGPLAYTGKISYGIYLFHVPIYYLVWTYLRVGSPAEYWPIVFLLSLAAAAASWRLVESPILRWRQSPRPTKALQPRWVDHHSPALPSS